ncbi:MAG: ATPase [Rubellimicrobium sp.]|nr:ATPase [Rubellimicrobium sp.]
MAEWKARVFWSAVTVAPVEGGQGVFLDGRAVRTPNRRPLILPTRALADLVAAEWAAQEGEVRPATMPATRLANSALEKVRPVRADVVGVIAAYGGADLICHRAEAPGALVARQAQAWDPLLDWAGAALGARLVAGSGIMPIAQEPAALAALAAEVAGMDDFRLAALHELVALSGSLVIALAVVHDVRDPETAWDLSRIDEDWQIEQWGADDEAAAQTAARRRDFLFAARFHALV